MLLDVVGWRLGWCARPQPRGLDGAVGAESEDPCSAFLHAFSAYCILLHRASR